MHHQVLDSFATLPSLQGRLSTTTTPARTSANTTPRRPTGITPGGPGGIISSTANAAGLAASRISLNNSSSARTPNTITIFADQVQPHQRVNAGISKMEARAQSVQFMRLSGEQNMISGSRPSAASDLHPEMKFVPGIFVFDSVTSAFTVIGQNQQQQQQLRQQSPIAISAAQKREEADEKKNWDGASTTSAATAADKPKQQNVHVRFSADGPDTSFVETLSQEAIDELRREEREAPAQVQVADAEEEDGVDEEAHTDDNNFLRRDQQQHQQQQQEQPSTASVRTTSTPCIPESVSLPLNPPYWRRSARKFLEHQHTWLQSTQTSAASSPPGSAGASTASASASPDRDSGVPAYVANPRGETLSALASPASQPRWRRLFPEFGNTNHDDAHNNNNNNKSDSLAAAVVSLSPPFPSPRTVAEAVRQRLAAGGSSPSGVNQSPSPYRRRLSPEREDAKALLLEKRRRDAAEQQLEKKKKKKNKKKMVTVTAAWKPQPQTTANVSEPLGTKRISDVDHMPDEQKQQQQHVRDRSPSSASAPEQYLQVVDEQDRDSPPKTITVARNNVSLLPVKPEEEEADHPAPIAPPVAPAPVPVSASINNNRAVTLPSSSSAVTASFRAPPPSAGRGSSVAAPEKVQAMIVVPPSMLQELEQQAAAAAQHGAAGATTTSIAHLGPMRDYQREHGHTNLIVAAASYLQDKNFVQSSVITANTTPVQVAAAYLRHAVPADPIHVPSSIAPPPAVRQQPARAASDTSNSSSIVIEPPSESPTAPLFAVFPAAAPAPAAAPPSIIFQSSPLLLSSSFALSNVSSSFHAASVVSPNASRRRRMPGEKIAPSVSSAARLADTTTVSVHAAAVSKNAPKPLPVGSTAPVSPSQSPRPASSISAASPPVELPAAAASSSAVATVPVIPTSTTASTDPRNDRDSSSKKSDSPPTAAVPVVAAVAVPETEKKKEGSHESQQPQQPLQQHPQPSSEVTEQESKPAPALTAAVKAEEPVAVVKPAVAASVSTQGCQTMPIESKSTQTTIGSSSSTSTRSGAVAAVPPPPPPAACIEHVLLPPPSSTAPFINNSPLRWRNDSRVGLFDTDPRSGNDAEYNEMVKSALRFSQPPMLSQSPRRQSNIVQGNEQLSALPPPSPSTARSRMFLMDASMLSQQQQQQQQQNPQSRAPSVTVSVASSAGRRSNATTGTAAAAAAGARRGTSAASSAATSTTNARRSGIATTINPHWLLLGARAGGVASVGASGSVFDSRSGPMSSLVASCHTSVLVDPIAVRANVAQQQDLLTCDDADPVISNPVALAAPQRGEKLAATTETPTVVSPSSQHAQRAETSTVVAATATSASSSPARVTAAAAIVMAAAAPAERAGSNSNVLTASFCSSTDPATATKPMATKKDHRNNDDDNDDFEELEAPPLRYQSLSPNNNNNSNEKEEDDELVTGIAKREETGLPGRELVETGGQHDLTPPPLAVTVIAAPAAPAAAAAHVIAEPSPLSPASPIVFMEPVREGSADNMSSCKKTMEAVNATFSSSAPLSPNNSRSSGKAGGTVSSAPPTLLEELRAKRGADTLRPPLAPASPPQLKQQDDKIETGAAQSASPSRGRTTVATSGAASGTDSRKQEPVVAAAAGAASKSPQAQPQQQPQPNVDATELQETIDTFEKALECYRIELAKEQLRRKLAEQQLANAIRRNSSGGSGSATASVARSGSESRTGSVQTGATTPHQQLLKTATDNSSAPAPAIRPWQPLSPSPAIARK